MAILIRNYDTPEVNKKEILRYAAVGASTKETDALVEECLSMALPVISYRLCFTRVDIFPDTQCVDFGFAKAYSKSLAKNLSACRSAIIFAATLGSAFDRLLMKMSAVNPSKAFMLQAIGAERIEALCDMFCKQIKEEEEERGNMTRPRFSAGYGDLCLDFQRDIFRVLDAERKIGLTLNQSLLMSPSKSVSAIIGISHQGEQNEY